LPVSFSIAPLSASIIGSVSHPAGDRPSHPNLVNAQIAEVHFGEGTLPVLRLNRSRPETVACYTLVDIESLPWNFLFLLVMTAARIGYSCCGLAGLVLSIFQ
jgi:hypothetical protein